MTQGKLAVVVLAGGAGSRIGGGKPARMLGGVSLLGGALAQARRWSRCVAVAGEGAPVSAAAIADDPAIKGPLSGLASALKFAAGEGADLVLTIPCDTPFLPSDLPERLSAVIGQAVCAVPVSGGRLHPACGLWRPDALGALTPYAGRGRRSLTGFADAVGYATAEWPVSPRDPFFNINTPDDLERAAALL